MVLYRKCSKETLSNFIRIALFDLPTVRELKTSTFHLIRTIVALSDNSEHPIPEFMACVRVIRAADFLGVYYRIVYMLQCGVPGKHNVVIMPKVVRKEPIPNDGSPFQLLYWHQICEKDACPVFSSMLREHSTCITYMKLTGRAG